MLKKEKSGRLLFSSRFKLRVKRAVSVSRDSSTKMTFCCFVLDAVCTSECTELVRPWPHHQDARGLHLDKAQIVQSGPMIKCPGSF